MVFTGAYRRRHGLIENAHGGSLFLDELGDIPKSSQRGLRGYLDGRGKKSLGDDARTSPKVRLLVGGSAPLGILVQQRRVLKDFACRLYGSEIALLPLRERREDILPLAQHFLALWSASRGRLVPPLSDRTPAQLEERQWEGNARELKQAIEVAAELCEGNAISPIHLPAPLSFLPSMAEGAFPDDQRQALIGALQRTRGNIAAAARDLGVDPTTVRRWARRTPVDLRSFRHGAMLDSPEP